ncbi:MAG: hypothetical protein ACP5GX_08070 [Anaerolineae bacterium]
MDKSHERPDYLSYLMRLWRVRSGDETTWRASLQSARSGETHYFADLDRLCTFLRDQTGYTQVVEGNEEEPATTVILMIHHPGHGRADR